MNFVIGLPIWVNWKSDSYDLILVIIDQFMKIVHYKLIKVTIDVPGLAKVIIDMVMHHHRAPKLIVIN